MNINQDKSLLILFIKNPVEGLVKSRLAETIGEYPAFLIYKELLKRTHEITISNSCSKAVFYSNFIDRSDIWENENFQKFLQKDGNIGDRMLNAFADSFSNAYEKVVLIGSDIIGLNSEIIDQAFSALDNSDLVLGPAKDGGYYLIGLKKLHQGLFNDIDWSTEKVFSQTIQNAKQLKLSTAMLEELSDLDRYEDFQFLTNEERTKFNDKINSFESVEVAMNVKSSSMPGPPESLSNRRNPSLDF